MSNSQVFECDWCGEHFLVLNSHRCQAFVIGTEDMWDEEKSGDRDCLETTHGGTPEEAIKAWVERYDEENGHPFCRTELDSIIIRDKKGRKRKFEVEVVMAPTYKVKERLQW